MQQQHKHLRSQSITELSCLISKKYCIPQTNLDRWVLKIVCILNYSQSGVFLFFYINDQLNIIVIHLALIPVSLDAPQNKHYLLTRGSGQFHVIGLNVTFC